ncbi:MAG: hypothetical protein IPJ41_00065 [Phycisphaerales bacterium]|nr:hypothetical protein [Phycisphaerales bacterium]
MTDFARRVGRGRVTFAFNLINTIRHLPSDVAMLAHFDQMSRVLAPGGAYVVGLSLSFYGAESASEDVWVGTRKGTRVQQVVQYLPPRSEGNAKGRRERVLSHLCITRAGEAEHRDSSYDLRTYDLRQWRTLLCASSLREVASIDEAGEACEPGDGHYNLFVLTGAR